MEKLKEYKFIIILVLIILGLAFYWFEIRQFITIKKCHNFSINDEKKRDREDYEYLYVKCLRNDGIEIRNKNEWRLE